MKKDPIRDIQVIYKYGFLLLTPVGTSKGLVDVDTGSSPGNYRFDMGIEFEVKVEGHSRYTGSPFKGSKELFRVI